MSTRTLETDYLVVGCGAGGMAFTDTLIDACDADVIMVDRHHAPGGHWVESYPFVRLHQPSAFYGVNSLPLGRQTIDASGLNRGFYELASGPELCAYYDRVMREHLLASERVRYFPMCEYASGYRFASRLSGEEYRVKVRKSLVDARYLESRVPASYAPPFDLEPSVRCVPVGELPRVAAAPDGYVIIGGGKTAMDACVWLLETGVPPEDLCWIKPRESWLLNRAYYQGGDLVGQTYEGFSFVTEAIAQGGSVDEVFARLEAEDWVLRVDQEVAPAMFKGATVSEAEIGQLRRIENVVRLGHVRHIGRDRITLDDGEIPTGPGYLHVHCAAPGLNHSPAVALFGDGRITPQSIRFAQFTFSAALAGFVEATHESAEEKNRLCPTHAYPNRPADLVRGLFLQVQAELNWAEAPDVHEWVQASRLNPLRDLPPHLNEPRVQEATRRFGEFQVAAFGNMERLSAGMEA